jgi:hypothetical protein
MLSEMFLNNRADHYYFVGNVVYDNKECVYYAGFKSLFTNMVYKQYDYFLFKREQSVCVGKIHSIFVDKKDHNKLKIEAQPFEIRSDCSTTQHNVFEVVQSLELIEIDLTESTIKPAKVMYCDNAVDDHCVDSIAEHVVTSFKSYTEHAFEDDDDDDDEDEDDEDENDEDDSFIVDTEDEDDDDDFDTEDEDEDDEDVTEDEDTDDEDVTEDEDADKENQDPNTTEHTERTTRRRQNILYDVFFYYKYLKTSEADNVLVKAIEPKLCDLLISYQCDVRDTESTVYKELFGYIVEKYFNNETNINVLQKDSKYIRLKSFVEKAIGENYLDIFQFYKILID